MNSDLSLTVLFHNVNSNLSYLHLPIPMNKGVGKMSMRIHIA